MGTVVGPGDTSETQHRLGLQRPPRAVGDGEGQETKGGWSGHVVL